MPLLSNTTSGLLQRLAALAASSLEQAHTMDPGMYTSQEVFEMEKERIFQQQWICLGRTDALSKAGDYLSGHIGNQPIVAIKQKDGQIAAFANVCRHRMMTLLEGAGHCKRIVCPYHAWTYGVDGQLIAAPQMNKRPEFDRKNFSLTPIRCETWLGWVYVTLSESLSPVAEQLKGLAKVTAPYAMENYIEIDRQEHIWDTNWKLLTENFMEGYHLPVTHRATVGAYFNTEDTRFAKKPDPAFTYQTYTKTTDALVGTAHKNNKKLRGKQRVTSILPTVFPSHMFSLAPDHLWYLSLQPKGMGQVHIRYGLAIAPEVLNAAEDPEPMINEIKQFLDVVNNEDRGVVEGIYRGVCSPLSTPGPLCWLERENHEFIQYLSRRLNGGYP